MTVVDAHRQTGSPLPLRGLSSVELLVVSIWCGLAAGELEIAARIIPRAVSSTPQLFMMTRHFIWLVPLVNLSLFFGLGLVLVVAMRLWPRRATWWTPRLLVAAAILPVLVLAGRRIYLEAWLLVALGVAFQVAPVLERRPAKGRRSLAWSLPCLLGLVVLQAGWIVCGDQIKQWREYGRPLPPAGSPNVLLIVLDTVRADHLSLYGYPRHTSPNLDAPCTAGYSL